MHARSGAFALPLWIAVAQPASPYECQHFVIDVPSSFASPIERAVADGMTYGFLNEPAPGELASMILIAVRELGDDLPEFSQEELEGGAEYFLSQSLDSLKARRTGFSSSPSESVTLSGLVGRMAYWQAKQGDLSEAGINYAIISGSRLILIRVEGDKRQSDTLTAAASRAVQAMRIKTSD